MIFYPAIDLKDGNCVRLELGDMDRATVFNTDPADQARQFEKAGCEYIHLVDLNGAFKGRPVNAAPVKAILAAIDVPVQLGGGIRSMATIEQWLDYGIQRVILGTAAVRNPALVCEACQKWPNRIAVAIDAKGGKVAMEGWAEMSELAVADLSRRFEDAGVAAIIHTDIERDGVLTGPNIAASKSLADTTKIPVIASGGISSLEDLLAVKASGSIAGVISGRALYDGRIDLREALARLSVL